MTSPSSRTVRRTRLRLWRRTDSCPALEACEVRLFFIRPSSLEPFVRARPAWRFETYTILGRPSANEVVVNGAAARLVETGD
ncbi:aspartate 1-decarboxylase, partial [Streptomyces sp. NPDC048210]|uniref:aspartate 1-decarboxylase n=1 Tax=Streptomyces sp. NPDC048210 TaxID=3156657 RepID=UPI003432F0D3